MLCPECGEAFGETARDVDNYHEHWDTEHADKTDLTIWTKEHIRPWGDAGRRLTVETYPTRTALIAAAKLRGGVTGAHEPIYVRGVTWQGKKTWKVGIGLKGGQWGNFQSREAAMAKAIALAGVTVVPSGKPRYGKRLVVVEDAEVEKYHGWA